MGKKADTIIKDYIEEFGKINSDNPISEEEIERMVEYVEGSIKRNRLKKEEFDVVLGYFQNELENESAQEFCEELKSYLIPYFDLEAYRELNIAKQKKTIRNIFSHYSIVYDEDESYTEKDKKDIVYPCRRALNSIVIMVIGYNATREQCIQDARDKFAFEDEISAFIVDLILENKAEMREVYILKTLTSLADRLRRVEDSIDRFISFINAEEDSEDDD